MARFIDDEADGPSDTDGSSIDLEADAPSPRLAARVERAASQSAKKTAEQKEVDDNLDAATTDLEAKGRFRINASRILITYAQAPKEWTKDLVLAHIQLKKPTTIDSIMVAKELHRDGSPHYHCLVSFVKKIDVTNPRHFDLAGHHPNFRTIKRGKDNFFNTAEYVMKGGDYVSENINLFPNSKNFRKKKSDHDAWCDHVLEKMTKEVEWPIVLPEGTVLQKPTDPHTCKKRHVWLYGESDLGKTHWAHETFAGQKIYIASTATYAFDSYKGQEVIIFDDVKLDSTYKELICAMSNYFRCPSPLPQTRYNQKFWPINQLRTIIIICNAAPGADLTSEPWFTNRFNVVELTANNRKRLPLPAPVVRPRRNSSASTVPRSPLLPYEDFYPSDDNWETAAEYEQRMQENQQPAEAPFSRRGGKQRADESADESQ